MIILEENFKWHLEAFESELFIYIFVKLFYPATGDEQTVCIHRLLETPVQFLTPVQKSGGVMVWDVFLAHFRPLSANWALFNCHGLPEHCF